jgi:hypothetical protein
MNKIKIDFSRDQLIIFSQFLHEITTSDPPSGHEVNYFVLCELFYRLYNRLSFIKDKNKIQLKHSETWAIKYVLLTKDFKKFNIYQRNTFRSLLQEIDKKYITPLKISS